jgi:serine protease Do
VPERPQFLTLLFAAAGLALSAAEPPAPALDESDADIAMAMRLERAFQKVAARVKPSVVSLTVFTHGADWREEVLRLQESGTPYSPERRFTGSGVILDEAGSIITNEHVVRGAEQIRVMLQDGATFRAKVAGTDPRSDLAVIQPVTPLARKLIPAQMADSDRVAVGQWVLAIGNPFELAHTLTVGVVSARGRSLPSRSLFTDVFYANLIQTDAAINPGNSGGPLFNLRGELIGINTMIFSRTGRSEGFGFAIPANDIQPRLPFLKAGQPIQYGWLGLRLRNLEAGQEAFPENPPGVLVEEVLRDTPADRAGIQQGSRVLSYDGSPVTTAEELILSVGRTPVGKLVRVKLRAPAGVVTEVPVRVGLRLPDLVRLSSYDPEEAKEEAEAPNEFTWRGMRVRELPADEARKAGGKLRVVRVKKGSPADRAGFYEGAMLDELKSAGNAAILKLDSLARLREAAQAAKGGVYAHAPLLGYVLIEAE